MYKAEDIVVYGTAGICRIEGTIERKFGGEIIEYYILTPLKKEQDVVYIPVNNEKALSKVRAVLTVQEAESMLCLKQVELPKWVNNERERQKSFKDVLLYGTAMDLFKMIKQLYAHQIHQLEIGKRLHAADERYLRDAEKMIFEELSFVLNKTPEEIMSLVCTA